MIIIPQVHYQLLWYLIVHNDCESAPRWLHSNTHTHTSFCIHALPVWREAADTANSQFPQVAVGLGCQTFNSFSHIPQGLYSLLVSQMGSGACPLPSPIGDPGSCSAPPPVPQDSLRQRLSCNPTLHNSHRWSDFYHLKPYPKKRISFSKLEEKALPLLKSVIYPHPH